MEDAEDTVEDSILVGYKLPLDGLHEQHFDVGLVNIFHHQVELILDDNIDEFIGKGIIILPLFIQQHHNLTTFEVFNQGYHSAYNQTYF